MYTAKQLADLLHDEDAQMNLRTVRYYTQIGMLPPLELVGNKRVYTDRHLQYIRAILTLSKSGETLADIQQKLAALSQEEIAKIGEHLRLYQSAQLIQNETHVIADDVILSIGPSISVEMRTKVIETVARLLKEERNE